MALVPEYKSKEAKEFLNMSHHVMSFRLQLAVIAASPALLYLCRRP